MGGNLLPRSSAQADASAAPARPRGASPQEPCHPKRRRASQSPFRTEEADARRSAQLQSDTEAGASQSRQAMVAVANSGTLEPAVDADAAAIPVTSAVAVSVAVQDDSATASHTEHSKGNIAERQMPTLLPHASSSHRPAARASSPETLVPSLLKALSQAQGQPQLLSPGLLRSQVSWLGLQGQTHPVSQIQPRLEHQAAQQQLDLHSVALDHPQSSAQADLSSRDDSVRVDPSGQSEQPYRLASAVAEHFQQPLGPEAEHDRLLSAIHKDSRLKSDPTRKRLKPQLQSGDAANPQAGPRDASTDAAGPQAGRRDASVNAADPHAGPGVDAEDTAGPHDGPDPASEPSVVDRLIIDRFKSLSGAASTPEPVPTATHNTTAAPESQVCRF